MSAESGLCRDYNCGIASASIAGVGVGLKRQYKKKSPAKRRSPKRSPMKKRSPLRKRSPLKKKSPAKRRVAANSWVAFLRQMGGKGHTRAQLRRMYKAKHGAAAKKSPKRAHKSPKRNSPRRSPKKVRSPKRR